MAGGSHRFHDVYMNGIGKVIRTGGVDRLFYVEVGKGFGRIGLRLRIKSLIGNLAVLVKLPEWH